METLEVNECCSRTVGDLLKTSDQDRVHLEEALSHLFEDFFGQVLNYMEIALPYSRNGQTSENQAQFTLLRSKVLRDGNDKIREMKLLFGDYLVKKVYESKRTIITFPGRGKAHE